MTGYVATDRIRHNSIVYEAGDVLDADDFTEYQLEQLLAGGVIVAGMVDVDKADISDDPDAGDKTDTGDEPDAGDKAGAGNEPDTGANSTAKARNK